MDVIGHPACTKYCACASKVAQGTLNAQLTKTHRMHEALRLCIQNDPHSERGWIIVGSPECTKYCACASKVAQGTLNTQLTKTHKMHEALRLCVQNGPRSQNGWISLASQNAPSTAPVHQK